MELGSAVCCKGKRAVLIVQDRSFQVLHSLGFLVNRNLLPVTAQALEAHHASSRSEQRIITALADVHTGMDVSAALTDQDVAGQNVLTVSPLGPQAFALGITAVLGGTNALLMGEELKTNVHHNRVPSFL